MFAAIPTIWIVLIIVLIILIGLTIALYFFGKRMEKRQAEQEEQLEAVKQSISMLIIDKKRLKLKESGLPDQVISQTPWYAKRSKVPIVKAKVGPRIMTLIADERLFDDIPVKKEVKATVSGLYITGVRGLHGRIERNTEKKKGLRAWLLRRAGRNR